MFVHDIDQMKLAEITDIETRRFYALYLSQRRIVTDFYQRLPAKQYDYRMVDEEDRRSDTPRESLAHIIDTHYVYFDGLRSGELVFKPELDPELAEASKEDLLAQLDELEREFFGYLSSLEFQPEAIMLAPWGDVRMGQALHLVREHDILHIGWNLALMDHLGMERFPSLAAYWGS